MKQLGNRNYNKIKLDETCDENERCQYTAIEKDYPPSKKMS